MPILAAARRARYDARYMGYHTFPAGPDELDRSVMDSLRRLVHALRVFDRKAGRATGLGGAPLFVLGRLAAGEPASINELARRTATHQSSVSVVAGKLVARGLAARCRGGADGREVRLKLTAAGRRALWRAPAAAQEKLIGALAKLSGQDRAALSRLLGAWVEAAGLQFADPVLFFHEAPKRKSSSHARKGS